MLQIDLWKRVLIWATVVIGLLLAMPNAFYTRVETHNDAVKALEAGKSDVGLEEQVALWPDWLPSGLVNLGLDLRGGAQLLAEVRVEDVYAHRMDALWPEVRDALRDKRDQVGAIRRIEAPDGQLQVRIENWDGPLALGATVIVATTLKLFCCSLVGTSRL